MAGLTIEAEWHSEEDYCVNVSLTEFPQGRTIHEAYYTDAEVLAESVKRHCRSYLQGGAS